MKTDGGFCLDKKLFVICHVLCCFVSFKRTCSNWWVAKCSGPLRTWTSAIGLENLGCHGGDCIALGECIGNVALNCEVFRCLQFCACMVLALLSGRPVGVAMCDGSEKCYGLKRASPVAYENRSTTFIGATAKSPTISNFKCIQTKFCPQLPFWQRTCISPFVFSEEVLRETFSLGSFSSHSPPQDLQPRRNAGTPCRCHDAMRSHRFSQPPFAKRESKDERFWY